MDGKVGKILDVAMPIGAAVASTYGPNYAAGAEIGRRMWQDNRERYDIKKQGARLAEIIPELGAAQMAADQAVYDNVVTPYIKQGWVKDEKGDLHEVKPAATPQGMFTDTPDYYNEMVPTGQKFEASQYAPKPDPQLQLAVAAAKAGDPLTAMNIVEKVQDGITSQRLKALDLARETASEEARYKQQKELLTLEDEYSRGRLGIELAHNAAQNEEERRLKRDQFIEEIRFKRDALADDSKRWNAMLNQQGALYLSEATRDIAKSFLSLGNEQAAAGTRMYDDAVQAQAQLQQMIATAQIDEAGAKAQQAQIDAMFESANQYMINANGSWAAFGAKIDPALVEGDVIKPGDLGKPAPDTGGAAGTGTADPKKKTVVQRVVTAEERERKARLQDTNKWTLGDKKSIAEEAFNLSEAGATDEMIVGRLKEIGVPEFTAANIAVRLKGKERVSDVYGVVDEAIPRRGANRPIQDTAFGRAAIGLVDYKAEDILSKYMRLKSVFE